MTVASHTGQIGILTKGRHYSQTNLKQSFSSGDRGFEFATQVKSDVRWGS